MLANTFDPSTGEMQPDRSLLSLWPDWFIYLVLGQSGLRHCLKAKTKTASLKNGTGPAAVVQ